MSFALHGTTDGQRQLLEPKLLRVVATFTYVLVAMSDEWQHLMFDGRLLTHRGQCLTWYGRWSSSCVGWLSSEARWLA